jgi:tetratricopeptide (TPR) repeat protein
MKTSLVAIVFALAISAVGQAQQPAQSQSGAASPQASGASQSSGPVIKDPAEYNAYMAAIQQTDANAKISGLEAFLTQYPNSVVKSDAMELLLAAYQQTGNEAKTLDIAQKMLDANPNNVRALAILTYTYRAKAMNGGPDAAQNITKAQDFGQKGLGAIDSFPKPQGMPDADFDKLKTQMMQIFESAVGNGAFQNKDYPTAIKNLKAASDASPTDFSLVYPLALAYLQSTPPDYINGVWYASRASVIAPAQFKAQIQKYAESQYNKYHGGDDGWSDVLAQAQANTTQPAGFTIKPAPTPAEQAHTLATSKTPKDMSFAEWQMVLSNAQQPDQDTVWNAIKGVGLQMEGTVIAATDTELQIAASQDDIDQKRADIILTMTGPIPARLMPKVGATLDFGGTPESYTPNPFVMTMDKGTLLKAAAPAPTHHAPVHHKPAH